MHLPDLTEPTVNEQQIRRRHLASPNTRIATIKRLAQSPVVIPRGHTGNVETSILLFQRTLGTEDDAGRHGTLAARVADVETFDARGRLRQIQLSRERGEHLLHALLLRQPHPQTLRRIFLRHLNPADAETARRTPHLYRVPRAGCERLTERFRVVELPTDKHLGRRVLPRVILHDEGGQRFLRLRQSRTREIPGGTEIPPPTH